jgi:divalent metal cation (Fe/Co/Zn/Cd) transporter
LRLVWISVGVGVLTGGVSVVAGLRDHSLGVVGVGLGVLADVTGSAVLIWRFRAEQRQPVHSEALETRAAVFVAAALAIVSIVLTAESVRALSAGSHPGSSPAALASAVVTFAVLTPLAYAKRRLGTRMASRALEGDGSLSAIGAATSLLALAGLILYRALGWWWADRVAGLVVAALAAVEGWRTAPRPPWRSGHR